MSYEGLEALAEARHVEPMSTWPEHNGNHERTLMGVLLPDGDCLRCHLERVATTKALEAIEKPVAPKKKRK